LNKARETLPTEPAIWITAAKLEEANGNAKSVGKILERAVKSLGSHGVSIDREHWLKEAEACEKQDPPATETCKQIVRVTIGVGVEDEDRKRTWKADAEECIKRRSFETARAIYAHATATFPAKKGLWVRAATLEKTAGDIAAMDEVLKRAVQSCPQAEILWLMAAKERWLAGDVAGARDILEEAFVANSESEDIWLAAFKLEFENREPERARALLAKAREKGGASERVWMKSAVVEREVGDVAAERRLLSEGLEKFPQARSILHWFPYDRVGVVNAVP
jgi:pre-mRNA-processing factor 6